MRFIFYELHQTSIFVDVAIDGQSGESRCLGGHWCYPVSPQYLIPTLPAMAMSCIWLFHGCYGIVRNSMGLICTSWYNSGHNCIYLWGIPGCVLGYGTTLSRQSSRKLSLKIPSMPSRVLDRRAQKRGTSCGIASRGARIRAMLYLVKLGCLDRVNEYIMNVKVL